MSSARSAAATAGATLGLILIVGVRASAAQVSPNDCVPGEELAAAAASGRRIHEVRIVSAPPVSVAGFREPLHVTTRDRTIRQRLLMTAGDTVDTLRVAESLRRVRRLRFLTGAVITSSCARGGDVDVTVATRDGWSMRPRIKLRSSSSALVGLEESNLFGTGRSTRIYMREDPGQLAVGASYTDPALLGSTIGATVSRDVFRDGTSWGLIAATRDVGAFQRTNVVALASRSVRESSPQPSSSIAGDTVRRAMGSLLLSQRVAMSPSGGTFVQLGVEGERTLLVAGSTLPIVGPASVRRSFVGVDVGAARHTLRYVGVRWLTPPDNRSDQLDAGVADIPLGWTTDALIGIGRDFAAARPAAHLDVWAGRVWSLGRSRGTAEPRGLLVGDAWASGYRALHGGGSDWSAGSLRTSLTLARPASRGLWTTRIAAERLLDPDPDTRGLAMSDPVLRAFPPASRLAESTVSASVDRSRHIVDVPGGYVLGASVFAAASMRWDPAARSGIDAGVPGGTRFGVTAAVPTSETINGERLYVGSLGAGLLFTPHRFGRSAIRVDVGFPVVRSRHIAQRPYVSFTLTPPFGFGRQRSGAP